MLNGSFIISSKATAVSHPCLNKEVFKEFWVGFTYQSSELHIENTDELIFMIGNASALSLDGNDYTINVTSDGICVYAKNEKSLILGFMTLLDRIRHDPDSDEIKAIVDCCEIKDSPVIKNRMTHFCVFPETELFELRRFIRFCAALKYSHVIVEFWGMIMLDCMKELAWDCGFTKDEIAPIIKEANDLGLEIIPMFNHWGHASAGRVRLGKHVVLDQNPTLQNYFSDDGWCWDIKQPRVRDLLSKIRKELIELCGEGEYFHIGCDEAYGFELNRENTDFLCDFINSVGKDVESHGRKMIIWGDMFLHKDPSYTKEELTDCNAPSKEFEEYALSRIDKSIIIADWQYHALSAPIKTSFVFKNAGFECFICPWDRSNNNVIACAETAKSLGLSGIIHTTWHTLSKGMPYVTVSAIGCFEDSSSRAYKDIRTATAATYRRVLPSGGKYERSGWSKTQIGDIIN